MPFPCEARSVSFMRSNERLYTLIGRNRSLQSAALSRLSRASFRQTATRPLWRAFSPDGRSPAGREGICRRSSAKVAPEWRTGGCIFKRPRRSTVRRRRSTSSIVVFVSIEVSRVLGVLGAATALRAARCHGARPAERRASRTAVTSYPTSIVDGNLENCASKVAQIRPSRRAELVSPVRQQALLHSRACPTGSC